MPKIKIPPKTAGSWSKIDANNSEEPMLLSSLSLYTQKPSTTPQGPSFLGMNGASLASGGRLPDPFTLLTKKDFPVSATTDVENVFGVSGQAAEPHQTFHMATSSLYITAHDLHRYRQYTGIVIVRLLGVVPSDLNSDNRGVWLEKNNIDYYIVLPLLDVPTYLMLTLGVLLLRDLRLTVLNHHQRVYDDSICRWLSTAIQGLNWLMVSQELSLRFPRYRAIDPSRIVVALLSTTPGKSLTRGSLAWLGDLVWEFIISAYITLTDEGGESQDFQARHVYRETFTTNESLANIARSSGVVDFMLGQRRHADHQRVLVSDPVSRPMQRFTLAAAPVSQDRVKSPADTMEALFAIFILEQSQVDLDLFDLLSMGIGFGFKFPYLARSTGVLGGHESLKPLDVNTYFRNRVRLSPDAHDEVFINSIGFSYGEKGHYLEFVVNMWLDPDLLLPNRWTTYTWYAYQYLKLIKLGKTYFKFMTATWILQTHGSAERQEGWMTKALQVTVARSFHASLVGEWLRDAIMERDGFVDVVITLDDSIAYAILGSALRCSKWDYNKVQPLFNAMFLETFRTIEVE